MLDFGRHLHLAHRARRHAQAGRATWRVGKAGPREPARDAEPAEPRRPQAVHTVAYPSAPDERVRMVSISARAPAPRARDGWDSRHTGTASHTGGKTEATSKCAWQHDGYARIHAGDDMA